MSRGLHHFFKGRPVTWFCPSSGHGLDPGQGGLRGGKGFEALHLPSDPLDEPMVLLDDIVQVFDLQNFNEPAPAA